MALSKTGGVVERLMAPVLKTGRAKDLVGSNPTPSSIAGFFVWLSARALLISRVLGGPSPSARLGMTMPALCVVFELSTYRSSLRLGVANFP